MQIILDLINGVSIGIEYVSKFGDEPNTLVDLLILRILIQWE